MMKLYKKLIYCFIYLSYSLYKNYIVVMDQKEPKNKKKYWICGILHLSSKVSYGGKNGAVIKRFTAFDKFYDETTKTFHKIFNVSTKKGFCSRDWYVVIRFTGYNSSQSSNSPIIPNGEIEQYIGQVGEIEFEQEYLKLACSVTWTNDKIFASEVNELIDIYESVRIKSNVNAYSIDPDGCIDIDDAIHIKKMESGFEVGVHIADVSSYINIGSPLDLELAHRCETLYLKHYQVNMLPKKLLEKCSLIKGCAKRVFSCIMTLEQNLNIVDVKFVHQIITISENLTYDTADKLIKKETNEDLKMMFNIGKTLYVEDQHNNYDTHKMVEIYMVMANSLVAKHIVLTNKDTALLRRHSGSRKNPYRNEVPKHLLDKANLLLMSKASYCIGTQNETKHIGLDKDVYTHFTSPIRRYADIIVHRMLSGTDKYKHTHELETIITKMNETHSKFNKCERLSYQLSKIYKIKDTIGEVFEAEGYIISIDKNKAKIFIEKYDITVEGYVFSEKLKDLVTCTANDDILKLESKSNGTTIILNMFQKVIVQCAITITQRHKLIVQIVDPDIMSLFINKEFDYDLFIDDLSSN